MFFISQNKKSLTCGTTKGFTLAELLVSIGIMIVITSTVLFNQSSYTSAISLTNLANDISLTIRQAQIYGVSVKQLQAGSNDFSSAYGVEFNTSSTGDPTGGSYIFFADRGVSKNGYYDGTWDCPVGGASECLQKIMTTSGNTISQLCILRTNDNGVCSGNPAMLVNMIAITFLRPSNTANIVFFNNGGQVPNPSNIQGAQITVSSPTGLTHSVVVYTTGQISVK